MSIPYQFHTIPYHSMPFNTISIPFPPYYSIRQREVLLLLLLVMGMGRAASPKSKIFIFRIDGEQPHQGLYLLHRFWGDRSLPNTTSGRPLAAPPRAGLRPVDPKAMQKLKTLVWLLSIKPKNKYFAFGSRCCGVVLREA